MAKFKDGSLITFTVVFIPRIHTVLESVAHQAVVDTHVTVAEERVPFAGSCKRQERGERSHTRRSAADRSRRRRQAGRSWPPCTVGLRVTTRPRFLRHVGVAVATSCISNRAGVLVEMRGLSDEHGNSPSRKRSPLSTLFFFF